MFLTLSSPNAEHLSQHFSSGVTGISCKLPAQDCLLFFFLQVNFLPVKAEVFVLDGLTLAHPGKPGAFRNHFNFCNGVAYAGRGHYYPVAADRLPRVQPVIIIQPKLIKALGI
jgi:hypothetical protein